MQHVKNMMPSASGKLPSLVLLRPLSCKMQCHFLFNTAIIAGAAGCPLAQTLAEGGLKTLLLGRGPEPDALTRNKVAFAQAHDLE